jgi:hypothetical protein
VDNATAVLFASAFYQALLNGHRFMDAVASARRTAFEAAGNLTWAAYQCYGDPDWTLRRNGADSRRQAPPSEDFSDIGSPTDLVLVLETMEVNARRTPASIDDQRRQLVWLEQRFAPQWGHRGQVAERFGHAWASAGDYEKAIAWFERARDAADGGSSNRALEQLGNLYVRQADRLLQNALQKQDETSHPVKPAGGGAPKRARGEHRTSTRDDAFRQALAHARQTVKQGLTIFEGLSAGRSTMEFHSLWGSAYKRLAMIEAAAGDATAESLALEAMRTQYFRAEEIGYATASPHVFYPAMNRMAAELALHSGRSGWKGLNPEALARVQQHIRDLIAVDPDFWSILGLIETELYEAISERRIAVKRAALEQAYRDTYTRVSSRAHWASAYQAARFVLEKYRERATAKERSSADTLLDLLRGFAAGT